MDSRSWLSAVSDALASAAGVRRDDLDLTEPQAEKLLDLARIAAHDTEDRTNAPLLCYLVGLAAGKSGKELDELASSVPGSTRH